MTSQVQRNGPQGGVRVEESATSAPAPADVHGFWCDRLAMAARVGACPVDCAQAYGVLDALRSRTGERGPDDRADAVGMAIHGSDDGLRCERPEQPLRGRSHRGDIEPALLVTHRLPIDDAPGACRALLAEEDGCIEAVLQP